MRPLAIGLDNTAVEAVKKLGKGRALKGDKHILKSSVAGKDLAWSSENARLLSSSQGERLTFAGPGVRGIWGLAELKHIYPEVLVLGLKL